MSILRMKKAPENHFLIFGENPHSEIFKIYSHCSVSRLGFDLDLALIWSVLDGISQEPFTGFFQSSPVHFEENPLLKISDDL